MLDHNEMPPLMTVRQYRIRSHFVQIEGDPAQVTSQPAGSTIEVALV